MRWWQLGLLFVFSMLLGGVLVAYLLNQGLFSLRADDKFEVFLNLLLVTLAIGAIAVAVAIWAFSKWLDGMEEQHRQTLRQEMQQEKERLYKSTWARYHLAHSMANWEDYEAEWRGVDWGYNNTVKQLLDRAIRSGETALATARELDPDQNRGLIVLCYNNVAYHLASRYLLQNRQGHGNESDKKLALGYAQHVEQNVSVIPRQEHALRETVAWVFYCCGVNDEGEEALQRALACAKFDPTWQKDISQKYKLAFGRGRQG